jgi:hypothetical protein
MHARFRAILLALAVVCAGCGSRGAPEPMGDGGAQKRHLLGASATYPPPYALVQVVLNGAPAVTGGQVVAGSETVAFSGVSTQGWVTALWEIYDYPSLWVTPSGWTLMSTGIIQYSGSASNMNPPQFTLPSTSTWGKWGVRLTVNGGIDPTGTGPNLYTGAPNPRMVDTNMALSMYSPHSLHDMFVGENAQFGGTPSEAWVRDYKWNLRILEAFIASGGGGGGGGGPLNFVPVLGPATVAVNPGFKYGLDPTGGAITLTVANIVSGPAFSQFGVISWCDVAAGNTVIQDPSVSGHTITIDGPSGGKIQDPENIGNLNSSSVTLTIKGEGANFFYDGSNLVLTP